MTALKPSEREALSRAVDETLGLRLSRVGMEQSFSPGTELVLASFALL